MVQEFVQQVKDTTEELLQDVHTVLPGKIVSVDYSGGMATVLPVMKMKASNGSTVNYPQISGVPIVFPQGNGQGTSITFPVKAGDSCLLVVAEQSLEYWMYGMETDTDLRFDISNAICIPGLFVKAPGNLQEACDGNSLILNSGSTSLIVSPGGVTIEGSLSVTGTVNASTLNTSGEVTGNGIKLSTHTHTSSDPGSETSTPN